MEYPGAIFTRPFRLLFLIFFIVLFILITPTIILYTVGYRYDWQHGLLKEIGGISVDVLPKNATASLNGLSLREKMPIRLTAITPGKHVLRVTAPGYYDWEKELIVKNKQTVYIKDIQMIRKVTPQLLQKEKIAELSISPDGQFLLYVVPHDRSEAVWLFDISNNSSRLLLTLPSESGINIQWKNTNHFALLTAGSPVLSRAYFIDPDNSPPLTDLIATIGAPIERVLFADSTEPQLFLSASSSIFSYTPTSGQFTPIAPQRYLDWYVHKSQLWTLGSATSSGEVVLRQDLLGFPQEFARVPTRNGDSADNARWRIGTIVDDTVLLRHEQSDELLLVTPKKQFKLNGEQFLISPYDEWWLIWSPLELWSYTAGEEPFLRNRSGEHLRKVVPLDKFNTLALVWENKTTVLFPYYFIEHDLLTNTVSDLVADSDERILYFSGKILGKEGLWKMEY